MEPETYDVTAQLAFARENKACKEIKAKGIIVKIKRRLIVLLSYTPRNLKKIIIAKIKMIKLMGPKTPSWSTQKVNNSAGFNVSPFFILALSMVWEIVTKLFL
jgi:hypothetical protein